MHPRHTRRSTKDTKTSKYSSLKATSGQANMLATIRLREGNQTRVYLARTIPRDPNAGHDWILLPDACVHHQHFARLMSRCRQVQSSVTSVNTGSCQNIAAIESRDLIGVMIDDPTPLGLSEAVSYGWWEVYARMSLHTPTGACQRTLST